MKILVASLFFVVLAHCTLTASGLVPRLENTSQHFPLNAPNEGYSLVDAYGLTFDEPVAIASPPNDNSRLFILERSGRIMVIPNIHNPTKEVFLDLRTNTSYSQGNIEVGLLGFAFHPNYANNGYFYVYRTQLTSSPVSSFGLHDVLSRFSVSPTNPNLADPTSELQIIVQIDGSGEHNAGDIKFGPDGYLYLSLGDSSPTIFDQSPNPQAIDKGLFSGIIRIDVDKKLGSLPPNPHHSVTTNYAIPPDNPFVGISEYQGQALDPSKVRTEFFAIGFRNPWKMAFNPSNGDLYVGDVGGSQVEEVSKVTAGGNFGWPYYEGTKPLTTPPQGFAGNLPIIEYMHSPGELYKGQCVIGGVFYTGTGIPELTGAYVYGDFRSGNIWHIFPENAAGTQNPSGWLASSSDLSCFGIEPGSGDVLVGDLAGGRILRLVHRTSETADPFPKLLSETGIFSDLSTLTPENGIVPYDINHTFWSDHAIKKRWFSVPHLSDKMTFVESGNWVFPAGTVWVKHFDVELVEGVPSSRRRLETRVLVKSESGAYGVTYRWNETGSDATIVPAIGMDEPYNVTLQDGSQASRVWHYPQRGECMQCHTKAAGYALGFSTAQLNRLIDYASGPEEQITALHTAGYLSNQPALPQNLERLSEKTDERVGLTHRAKSYLAANCSFCHLPGNGTLDVLWDARMATSPSEMKIFDRLISPRNVPGSFIHTRASTRSKIKMPPIASLEIDTEGIQLLRRWINGFPTPDWNSDGIGATHSSSGSSMEGNTLTVSGSGLGINGQSDQLQFLSREITGNSEIVVRLDQQYSRSGVGRSGVLLRKDISPNAPAVMLSVSSSGEVCVEWRSTAGESALSSSVQMVGTDPVWLKVRKRGQMADALFSSDGIAWTEFVNGVPVDLENTFLAGVAVSNRTTPALNTAQFSNFKQLGVSLNPIPNLNYVAPDLVNLNATPFAFNTTIQTVRFYADDLFLGEVGSPPYNLTWSNARAGTHGIRAEVVDAAGTTAVSEIVPVEIQMPDPEFEYGGQDSASHGQWIGLYGAGGYALANGPSSIPPDVIWNITANAETAWNIESTEQRALAIPDASARLAARWQAPTSISLSISFSDGEWHNVSLYFLDWENSGLEQTITLKDASGLQLNNQTVSAFSAGKYLSWNVRGSVEFCITGNIGGAVVLSGVFIDDLGNGAPPTVNISSPLPSTSLVAGRPFLVVADAQVTDGTISKVEFLVNGNSVHIDQEAPFEFEWTNGLVGDYTVVAKAFNNHGGKALSPERVLTIRPPISSAVFLNEDNATHGNWIGKFGSEGYMIMNHSDQLPSYVPLQRIGGSSGLFGYPDFGDERGLLQEGGTSRIIAPWFSLNQWSMSVELNDGESHAFSIYTLDWNQANWAGRVKVVNPDTEEILDEREISDFATGRYLTWALRGHLRFDFESDFGHSMVAGVFLERISDEKPVVSISQPLSGEVYPLHAGAIIEVNVASSNSGISKVILYEGDHMIATLTDAPYITRWVPDSGGFKNLSARAVNVSGQTGESLPVTIEFVVPAVSAGARYLNSDLSTQGNWQASYGQDGFVIPGYMTQLPNYALFDPHRPPYVWTNSTGDFRAIRRLDGTSIASTWTSTSFTADLDLLDGRWHRVGLYFLDWDSVVRGQAIEIRDRDTGQLLDTREVTSFHDGIYLNWNLRGHISIKFTKFSGSNALLNGVFFQQLSEFENWQLNTFTSEEMAVPALSAPLSDSDQDQLANLLEYKLGTHPKGHTPPPLSLTIDGDDLLLVWEEAIFTDDATLSIETSTDLQNWFPATVISESRDLLETKDRVTLRIRRDEPESFFRMVVTKAD